ncbi:hypothetical protein FOZ63_034181, partial [Perkinsus olseni]
MACFNTMSKKLQAEVKRLDEELNSAIAKLGSLEAQASEDRDGHEEMLKGYRQEVERLVKSVEDMKANEDMASLKEELQGASQSLEEVRRVAAEEKAEHSRAQEKRDKEVLDLKRAIEALEASSAEAKAALMNNQAESAKERGEIGKSLESLKEELRIAAAKQAEKEQEQQLQLSLKPDDVDTNVDVLKEGRVRLIFHRARGLASSSPSAVANGVVLAKLLRSSDGTVVYSSSTLRCAIDNWDGSCDINEELVLPIAQGRQAEELIVQMSLMAQTKEYSRELLSLTFKPAALDPFSPAHVLARSKNSDQGEVSQVSLALTAAHEPSFESLRGHNQRLLLLELKIHRILHSQSLPDAVTAGVVAVHPSGEESTPEPVFHNFYYDQDQTLTLFLKEKFTDARRSGTSEPLVCITPGSAGTSVAPNWRRSVMRMMVPPSRRVLKLHLLVPDPTSALPKLKPVAVGNLDLRPLLDDDGVSSLGARSYHVDMRPLVSPHLTATLELDARLW